MSIVTVRLFASYADLVGSSTIDVPIRQGDTVSDLLDNIRSLPAASTLPAIARVAVNRTFASDTTRLHLEDEIALIPPVAGG
ncbi:MAG TPA: MoaD/ThiS family protein [Gemmatimonadaceae bacterium]|nr:MoaD/ThiS family protein [Gemmatimonadaceae bacterium]